MLHNNKIYTLRFMADLLHPTAKVKTSYFPASESFWNLLIQLGSKQLVLPAIYGALKYKKLENHIPNDLLLYLKKISNLNKQRNDSILNQITFLSRLFKKNGVEYVFLKGAALLKLKPYNTIKERMVGDIDILISEKDLLRAKHLLFSSGFEEVSKEFSFTHGVLPKKNKRHLKRVVHPNFIAAVEIHFNLLDNNIGLFSSKEVLENKTKLSGDYWIPSRFHLWKHAVLNWQYNDNGMALNYLGFRSLLDVLYLERKDFFEEINNSNRAIKQYYNLLSFYYNHYPAYFPLKKIVYEWQLRSSTFFKLNFFYNKLINFMFLSFSRIGFFLKSDVYRKRVLNNPKLFLKRFFEFFS